MFADFRFKKVPNIQDHKSHHPHSYRAMLTTIMTVAREEGARQLWSPGPGCMYSPWRFSAKPYFLHLSQFVCEKFVNIVSRVLIIF